jgi:hypothetical protein
MSTWNVISAGEYTALGWGVSSRPRSLSCMVYELKQTVVWKSKHVTLLPVCAFVIFNKAPMQSHGTTRWQN